MTDRTWTGAENNSAGNPNNWSPTGVPVPGDTLAMPGGTMNIRDNDLAGDTLVFGTGQTPATTTLTSVTATLNLSHQANVALDVPQYASDQVTINVKGSDTLNVHTDYPSGGLFTVNLADHATLTGAFSIVFSSLDMEGGPGSRLVSSGSSMIAGSSAKFDTSVVGKGTFTVSSVQSRIGQLEFGDSVSYGQNMTVIGDLGRYRISQIQIDRPDEFKGAVGLGVFGEVDLVGLTNADSYQLKNDILSIYSGCNVIDTLRLTTPPPQFSSAGSSLGVTVSRTSTGLAIDRGPTPFGSTPLPVHS